MKNNDTIILNRIYTGDYLDEGKNLGHEVINLFKHDDESAEYPYYLYLMSDGTYPTTQSKNIEAIYFTKAINSNCVEVLSVATDIEPVFEPSDGFSCLSGGEDEIKKQFNELLSRQNLNKINEALEIDDLNENIKWLDKYELIEHKKNLTDYNEFKTAHDKLINIAKKMRDACKKIKSISKKEVNKTTKAIIRRALHLWQLWYINENKITYGRVPIDKIFQENTSEQYGLAIFITYKAKKIKKPNKKLYLVTDDKYKTSSENAEYINIDRDRLATTKLATYFKKNGKTTKYDTIIYNEDGTKCKDQNGKTQRRRLENDEKEALVNAEKKNFTVLKELINNQIFDNNLTIPKYTPIESENDTFTFLTLIKKEYDEIVFSNMFQFFFSHNNYRHLFKNFIFEITKNKINLEDDFVIGREINNIDLLVTDSKNVVVIENKVKSSINGLKYDEKGELIEDQLDKYRDYVDSNYADKNKYYIVFLPNYSVISKCELKEYEPVYYSQIFDHFKSSVKKKNVQPIDVYYNDFITALSHHSTPTDNPNEEIMRRRLQENIERANRI